MKHRSKVEVWLFAAILYVVGVLAAGGNRWIGGPVLLVLLLIALPQEYVTAPKVLRVRAGLTRWAIPYDAITFVGESSMGPLLGKRISVRMGLDSEILLAPDDPGAFFDDGSSARSAPDAARRRAGGCVDGRCLQAGGLDVGAPVLLSACYTGWLFWQRHVKNRAAESQPDWNSEPAGGLRQPPQDSAILRAIAGECAGREGSGLLWGGERHGGAAGAPGGESLAGGESMLRSGSGAHYAV